MNLLKITLSFLCIFFILNETSGAQAAYPVAGTPSTEESVSVPFVDEAGNESQIQTRICYPKTNGNSIPVILNHDASSLESERVQQAGFECSSESAQWFLKRGYAVVSPIRRGYGKTGGAWVESYGACTEASIRQSSLETARDMTAVVNYLPSLPKLAANKIVVVGEGSSGIGTVVLNSLNLPNVAALINLAGRNGAHMMVDNQESRCSAMRLAFGLRDTVMNFAQAPTKLHMLWVYADNDIYATKKPYLNSDISQLFSAYTFMYNLGQFVRTPPFRVDGQILLGVPGNSEVWGPSVEKYLELQLSPAAPYKEEWGEVPITDAAGNTSLIQTRICYPDAKDFVIPVVINHGSPVSSTDRIHEKGYECTSEPAQWFLKRGYAVVSPIRRGYGITGGVWAESYGTCDQANFLNAGLETARDISAVINYLPSLSKLLPATLPKLASNQVIVIGQSAGGFGTIALNSLKLPQVVASINMGGGRGGHKDGEDNQNCSEENLVKAVTQYGVTSTAVPMLWVYTQNDSFFSPSLSQKLFSSYQSTGGLGEFVLKPKYDRDGHFLFGGYGGSGIWGSDVEKYLNTRLKALKLK